MKKFQFFLVIEGVLVALALMTILEQSLPRFILANVLLLMAIRYYNISDKVDFFLTTFLLILFLITMLNPFIILAILFAVVYMLINHFSQVKKKNRYALITFSENEIKAETRKNKWIGDQTHIASDQYVFDDINIIRLSGNDIIDLDNVIVSGSNNMIVIRKIYGPTRIIVPVDVEVKLNCSSIYGSVKFLGQDEYDLRNETLQLQSKGYNSDAKSVKIFISLIAGSVEVVSA